MSENMGMGAAAGAAGEAAPNSAEADPSSALAAVGVEDSAMARHQRSQGKRERTYDINEPAEEGGTEFSEPKAEDKMTKEQKKQWKLRLKDQEKIVESEEEMTALAQKGLLFDQHGREVVKTRREAQEAIQVAKEREMFFNQALEELLSDPVKALVALNKGNEAAVREKLQPYIEEAILRDIEDERNPQNKMFRELQARAERAEALIQQQEQQRAQQAQEQERGQWRQHWEQQILKQLQSSKLPASPRVVKAYADQLYRHAQLGIEPNPDVIAENVRLGLNEDVQATAGEGTKRILEAHSKNDTAGILAGLDELTQVLGGDVIKAIRIADLTRLKQSRSQFPDQTIVADAPKSPEMQAQAKKKGYMDMDDWREETRQRALAIQRGQG